MPCDPPITARILCPGLEGNGRHFRTSSSRPTPPIAGVGRIALATAGRLAFVVEADVARDDRVIRARGRHRPCPTRQPTICAMISGRCGLAKLRQLVIGKRTWPPPRDVAIGFCNRLFAAFIGIGIAIARGAVGADRQRLFRAVHAHHSGIAARFCSGVGADLLSYCSQIQPARRDRGRPSA
jgi:hypothetical protein